uniref:Uncharacterized protein n=1 Tax=Strongyloides venezuelensis TaxID=75913 RepID=A0A0K0FLZ1_STRVS
MQDRTFILNSKMITLIFFVFFTTIIHKFCYGMSKTVANKYKYLTLFSAQYLPLSINSIPHGDQGQNEQLPRNFDFNSFNSQKNDFTDTGNDYYPQFSPNTPFMEQNTLYNDKHSSAQKPYFETMLNEQNSKDNSLDVNRKVPHLYENDNVNSKNDISSDKEHPVNINTDSITTDNSVQGSNLKTTNVDLSGNKTQTFKSLSGFFPYEFEKDTKIASVTLSLKNNNVLDSPIHLPYKPIFPILNKNISPREKGNFPMPSKLNLLSSPYLSENNNSTNIENTTIISVKSSNLNRIIENKKVFNPTNDVVNVHDKTNKFDGKSNIEEETNKEKSKEMNENFPKNTLNNKEDHFIKPSKDGIPGFPSFNFMESLGNPNTKTNNPFSSSSSNPHQGNNNQIQIPNIPNFPNFGLNNNNFFNFFPQMPKIGQPNMPPILKSKNLAKF